MPKIAIRKGARGSLVMELQNALNIAADGIYGRDTTLAVSQLQERAGLNPHGQADPQVFGLLGMQFPSEFEICYNLTGQYEGTGGQIIPEGGINSTDIDGAGVTLGAVGLTTAHGEVQWFLRQWYKQKPEAFDILPTQAKGRLIALCTASSASRQAWERWFFGNDKRVEGYIVNVFRAWGKDPLFRSIQKQHAYETKWKPAVEQARRLKVPSIYGCGLLFDIVVQNGGWKEKHQTKFNQMSGSGLEVVRLRNIAESVALCAKPKWQEDVRTRKMTFVTGGGKVHGRDFILTEYGFPKEG